MLRKVFFLGVLASFASSWVLPIHGRNTCKPIANDVGPNSTLRVNPAITYTHSYWVPVASHAGGDKNSQWRTDVGILNTGMATANIELRHIVGSAVKTNTTYVPAGSQSILTDVVGQIGSSGTGPIQVRSDQPVVVTSRTYNQVASDQACYANGTQGQSYPTLADNEGLAAGQSAVLPQLVENDAYRSNITLINVSGAPATATVTLFDGAGTSVGSYDVPLQPGERKQKDKAFRTMANQTDMAQGYAKVQVNTGSGVVAFAAVADNITNDPTTIGMGVPPVLVPVPEKITEYSAGITAGASPDGITTGPDGALWFTEFTGNRIGRITTAGVVTEYGAGIAARAQIECITVGPDGALWFAESKGNRIGRITTEGVVTEFGMGITKGSMPLGITAGPDGALWFAEFNTDRIGRITTAGVVTEYSKGITRGAGPDIITAGPDGALWFTEFNIDRIGRITTAGVVTEFGAGITAGAGPAIITAGPDGALWFTEFNMDRIGRITTDGVVTEFSIGITAGAKPNSITSGPDGALWFTEFGGNRIGRITTEGVVTEYSMGITEGAGLGGITTGPDGALWFSEMTGNRIGQFTGPGLGSQNAFSVWVPVASHAGGDKNSQWRTDIGILNSGIIASNIELRHIVGSVVKTTTTNVPAGSQSILTDVVGQIGSSGTGPIQVRSDQPVVVTSRTYNQVASDQTCYANGTQGQSYPTLADNEGLFAGQSAVLPQLVENDACRSNITLINVSGAPATATVTLFDGAGTSVGNYDVELQPGERKQQDKAFRKVGNQTDMAQGYAKVLVNSGSGVVAFATVADNITNDPTTILMVKQ